MSSTRKSLRSIKWYVWFYSNFYAILPLFASPFHCAATFSYDYVGCYAELPEFLISIKVWMRLKLCRFADKGMGIGGDRTWALQQHLSHLLINCTVTHCISLELIEWKIAHLTNRWQEKIHTMKNVGRRWPPNTPHPETIPSDQNHLKRYLCRLHLIHSFQFQIRVAQNQSHSRVNLSIWFLSILGEIDCEFIPWIYNICAFFKMFSFVLFVRIWICPKHCARVVNIDASDTSHTFSSHCSLAWLSFRMLMLE